MSVLTGKRLRQASVSRLEVRRFSAWRLASRSPPDNNPSYDLYGDYCRGAGEVLLKLIDGSWLADLVGGYHLRFLSVKLTFLSSKLTFLSPWAG